MSFDNTAEGSIYGGRAPKTINFSAHRPHHLRQSGVRIVEYDQSCSAAAVAIFELGDDHLMSSRLLSSRYHCYKYCFIEQFQTLSPKIIIILNNGPPARMHKLISFSMYVSSMIDLCATCASGGRQSLFRAASSLGIETGGHSKDHHFWSSGSVSTHDNIAVPVV